MSVKVKLRNGAWWVYINYQGRRMARKIGTREAAEHVRRQLEARVALGDMGIFEPKPKTATFAEYAERWMREHAAMRCKPSTVRGYKGVLDLYLLPRFGTKNLSLSRDVLKGMFVE